MVVSGGKEQEKMFKIEKQIMWHFCLNNTANVFQHRLPFFATKIINHFLNSIISAKHVKGEEYHPMVKSLSPFCFSSLKSLLEEENQL